MKITYQQLVKGAWILWRVENDDGKTVIIGDRVFSGAAPTRAKARKDAEKALNHARTISKP